MTVGDLIELLETHFEHGLEVRFGRYNNRYGYYALETLNVDTMFVTDLGKDGESCTEEQSERRNGGHAIRAVVFT